MQNELAVQIWSDIACPWCYVGKRRFEVALAAFPERAAVTVRWRSFQLDPAAPQVQEGDYAERLGRKYGVPTTEARSMMDRMTEVARGDGLAFRFDRIVAGNTFDAHRLLHLANARGRQDAVKERFLAGYLCEGEPIGKPEALLRMAVEAGLEADEVASVLAGDLYAAEVRDDQAQARGLGVSGVPFFVIGPFGVSGAQSSQVLGEVIARAWDQTATEQATDGATCGPDGC